MSFILAHFIRGQLSPLVTPENDTPIDQPHNFRSGPHGSVTNRPKNFKIALLLKETISKRVRGLDLAPNSTLGKKPSKIISRLQIKTKSPKVRKIECWP